jgi:16S rRNA U516 pseudouridylate synthase RsuA-like enzyme
VNRLAMIEALKLSEGKIREVRQMLEALEREDTRRKYLEAKGK